MADSAGTAYVEVVESTLTRARVLSILGVSERVWRCYLGRPDCPRRYNMAASWGGTLWRYRMSEVQALLHNLLAEAAAVPAAPTPEESARGRAMQARRGTAHSAASTAKSTEPSTTAPAAEPAPRPRGSRTEERAYMGGRF